MRTAGCVRTINYSPEMVSVRTGLRAYRKSNTELACDPGHTHISNKASRVHVDLLRYHYQYAVHTDPDSLLVLLVLDRSMHYPIVDNHSPNSSSLFTAVRTV